MIKMDFLGLYNTQLVIESSDLSDLRSPAVMRTKIIYRQISV